MNDKTNDNQQNTAVVDADNNKKPDQQQANNQNGKDKKNDQSQDDGSKGNFDASKFSEGDKPAGDDNSDNQNKNKDDKNNDNIQDQDTDSKDDLDNSDAGGVDNFFSWDDVGEGDNKNNDTYQTQDDIDKQLGKQIDGDKSGQNGQQNKPVSDINKPHSEEDNWQQMAKDLNIDAVSYQDLISKIQNNKVVVTDDNNLTRINQLLGFTGEPLIRAVMKDNKMSDENIDKYIDNLKNQDILGVEEEKVKNELQRQKEGYVNYLKTEQEKQAVAKKQGAEKFEKDLKDELSKTESILGGKIGDGDKKAVYDHITSGNFQKKVVGDLNNLIRHAWFDLNESKVLKVARQKGISEGKNDLLNNINPKPNVANRQIPYDPNSERVFDPEKFANG